MYVTAIVASEVRDVCGKKPYCSFVAVPRYRPSWNSRIAYGELAVAPSIGTTTLDRAAQGSKSAVVAREASHRASGSPEGAGSSATAAAVAVRASDVPHADDPVVDDVPGVDDAPAVGMLDAVGEPAVVVGAAVTVRVTVGVGVGVVPPEEHAASAPTRATTGTSRRDRWMRTARSSSGQRGLVPVRNGSSPDRDLLCDRKVRWSSGSNGGSASTHLSTRRATVSEHRIEYVARDRTGITAVITTTGVIDVDTVIQHISAGHSGYYVDRDWKRAPVRSLTSFSGEYLFANWDGSKRNMLHDLAFPSPTRTIALPPRRPSRLRAFVRTLLGRR